MAKLATTNGTKQLAKLHSSLVYQELGATGFQVSQAGFGCYRVDVSIHAHEKALEKALLSGINVIDTSSNYSDGGSEALVGYTVEMLGKSEKVLRDSLVVVSKVGYLQGENYELSQKRKREGKPFPDLVLYGEGLEHCIHPEFIEDQLTRSLNRLQMQTVDVYLLHNPEYYLSWASHAGVSVDEARKEYDRRVGLAFQHLESEVKRGRIQWYGISSNTFPHPKNDFEFTSLETVWKIAESISSNHHFRVIQFPMNLFEAGAATEKNQSNGKTLLQFAREKRLGVLINRPLNAIAGRGLIRLADSIEGVPFPLAADIRDKICSIDPEWGKAETLSHIAIRALRSTEGVTTVLVGMRRESYVDDVLAELKRKIEIKNRQSSWKALG